jgi:LacI family transcriptional regulator
MSTVLESGKKVAKAPVGIRELARQLGLSIGTVSRALNNRYGVNPTTRTRVLEEARKLGYVPNNAARSLKDQSILNVGLLFAPFVSINNEISPVALRFIDLFREQTTLQNMSLRVILFTNMEEFQSQVTANHLDVVIFYGEFPPQAFDTIHELGLPAVLMSHSSHHEDQVSVLKNTPEPGERAVEYLAALGHEKIGFVMGPRGTMHVDGFYKGFRQGIAEFGLISHPEWIIELTPSKANKDGAAEALIPILSQKNCPTALIFSSDWMALGAYKAARELNLRIPEDLSVIGHDNLPVTSELTPPLTTFDVNTQKFAKLVVELAKDIGNRQWDFSNPAKRQILLGSDFIKRESCYCLRHVK